MFQPTQNLPEGYVPVFFIDPAVNQKLAIVLNAAALGVTLLTLWLLAVFTHLVRPGLPGVTFKQVSRLDELLLLTGLVAANMVLHELLHGAFFWFFTHTRPVFGLSLSYQKKP
jgi:hypothetical protein